MLMENSFSLTFAAPVEGVDQIFYVKNRLLNMKPTKNPVNIFGLVITT